jgi:hypothetical protein
MQLSLIVAVLAALVISQSSPHQPVSEVGCIKLAVASGIDRYVASWQHASIARRVEFLHRATQDPQYERQFYRRIFWFSSLLASIAWRTDLIAFCGDRNPARKGGRNGNCVWCPRNLWCPRNFPGCV